MAEPTRLDYYREVDDERQFLYCYCDRCALNLRSRRLCCEGPAHRDDQCEQCGYPYNEEGERT